MITKVKCANEYCQNYGIPKSVVSAGIMGMSHKKCPSCGGKMVVAARTKSAGPRGGRRTSGRR